MRNCFVPGCDNYCKNKNISQRKMFLAPKALYEKWRDRLHNKREFKKTDRVCERHFEPSDIVEYWENNINGEIHRTKRDKPKLRDKAIPCLHLPTTTTNQSTSDNKKVEILSNRLISKQRVENAEINETAKKKRKILVISPVKQDEPLELIDNDLDAKIEAFESLYDEAFDVTLPTTLWGFHRDPERKFVVFSSFDGDSMQFNKILHINDRLKVKITVNGETEEKTMSIQESNVEFLSEILDKIDRKS